jgi:branched-chain amino acid transport system ATP-binding protein
VTVFNRGRILIENTVDAVLADPDVRDVYLGKQTH